MSKWIKKGDKVVVITGNERGRTGEVVARKEDRVIVQGVNIRKKHAKRQQKAPGTQILEIEVPVHISNVALCDGNGKPIKVRVRTEGGKPKELYYVDGGKEVTLRQIRKTS
ncbi:MAG: 50S ribosomal protein L24 [Verrucomicrobia bacterium]|nr:50S ribosomal protein L24 [Verrucomicrobiota bacterium]